MSERSRRLDEYLDHIPERSERYVVYIDHHRHH
jgi:hypothetical protein